MNLTEWLPAFTDSVDKLKGLWFNEPLDGDATETVAKVFLAMLDRQNGNLTEREFNAKLNVLETEWVARMLDVY